MKLADALPNGGLITMLSDVTDERERGRERRRLEEKLRQSSKMEAIGRLAGGIAHDFNNMISGVAGFAGFLREDLDLESTERRFAERILQVCARAKDVVRQIMAFARADQVERTTIELRAALMEAGGLLAAELPDTSLIDLDAGAVPLPVTANAGQLHQLLLNLSVNASDALEGAVGTILVHLEEIDLTHADRVRLADARCEAGFACAFGGTLDPVRRYAAIRVSDPGAGMDQATLDLVFEPFFTTKTRRRGTGLGLAVVHGILQSSGGAFAVSSRLGVGTEFSVYLPVEAGELTEASAGGPVAIDGQERLLVVDDDPDLTDVLSIGLTRLGYTVTVSNNPLEVLARFEADPAAWDLVVTDQGMPAMDGTTLVARLKRVRPDCPVVLCSGLHDGATERDARTAGADAVVAKPIEPHELAAILRELLRAGQGGGTRLR